MEDLLIKSDGDVFVHNDRPIPKNCYRSLSFERSKITEDRTLELSVSSSKPYYRWWYWEELEHSESAVNLERFNDSAQLLFNHKRDSYIGVVEKAWLKDEKLYNQVRFDSHELAERIYNSVNSGIIRNVSIGYVIDELVLVKETKESDYYRATRWTPYETSLVTVPADATVGVGRSYYDFGNYNNVQTKKLTMEKEGTVLEVRSETDILRSERNRISQLIAAGEKYGCKELAQRAIEEGMSIDQARSLFLDKVTSTEQKPIALAPVEFTKKEQQQYSFHKAIAYAAGKLSREEAALEVEASKEIQKRLGRAPEGIYVDTTQLAVRAPYDTNTPSAAGNLIDTDLLSDRFIEQLYNNSAFLPMGVTYLRNLTGNIEIPRESTYQSAYWIGEGTTITEAEGTFDKISLDPKKLAVLSKMTLEMITQSSIDLENLTRTRLLRALALEIDRAIGFGTGVGEQPRGIVSHPEVNSIALGTNGGALNWAAVVSMQTVISNQNAMLNPASSGYVFNSATKGKLMTTLDHDTGAGRWIWQQTSLNSEEGSVAGYKARCSNQVPSNLTKGTGTNLSAAIFGDFSNVLLGLWSGMDIMVNPYSEYDKAIIGIRALQLTDIELSRGDYFTVVTDINNV